MNAAAALFRGMITVLVAAALTLPLASCNIVGPAAYLVTGPSKVDAEHALEDRPTVVFIDDRENVVNPVSLRRVIAEQVSEELMRRGLVTRTISPHDAMTLASRRDRANDVMPIDAIGRSVGAEQVIYIEMVAFQDTIDDTVNRARAICRVRVIDVENRRRVYPGEEQESPYRMVQVTTEEIDPDLYRSRASRIRIYERLANELAQDVTKLFYRHEARELGGRLQPR